MAALIAFAPASGQSARTNERPLPAAVVDGQRLEWSELQAPLAELAGALVLEEAILDRVLTAEAAGLGITADDQAVDRERRLLADNLALAAGVPPSEGETLIAQIRQSRGLGETRFAALLRRNALLRGLVNSAKAGEVIPAITDEDVQHAYRLKYGPRVRVRLILVRSQEAAAAAQRRLPQAADEPDTTRLTPEGEPARAETFAEVAAAMSIDPSAARGGLLDPFSLEDSSVPVALRRVLGQMKPGEVSPAVAVNWDGGEGYAIARLEEVIPARPDAPTVEEAAETLRAEIRLVRERAAMDRLAARLIASARVTVFDRSLDQAWKQRRGGQ